MHTTKRTSTYQMQEMDVLIDAEQQNQSLHMHHTVQAFDRMSLTNYALKNQIKQILDIHWIGLDWIKLYIRIAKHLHIFDKFMSNAKTQLLFISM